MDERRLEHFIAVAEELNFTRAATRLYASQSTVSAAIRSLEQELGAQLLTRTTRSVSLTEAGAAFLPEARAAAEALDRARASVEPITAGLRGNVALGTLNSLRTVDVPALAGEFHRRYPNVRLRIEISPRGAAGLTERVKAGVLDLAFVGHTGPDPDLDMRPLRRFELAVFVADTHRLATRSSVTLREIADEPFIELPLGFGQRTTIDDAFAREGLRRAVSVELMDIAEIPSYVAHGVGIAILPRGFAGDADRPVRAIPIRGRELRWTLSAISAKGRLPSRATTALRDLLPAYTTQEPRF